MSKYRGSKPAWWDHINWRAVRHYLGDQQFEVAAKLVHQVEKQDVSLEDTTIEVTLHLGVGQQELADSLIEQAIAGTNLTPYFVSAKHDIADGVYYYDLRIRDYKPFRLPEPVRIKTRRTRFSQRHA